MPAHVLAAVALVDKSRSLMIKGGETLQLCDCSDRRCSEDLDFSTVRTPYSYEDLQLAS